MVPSGCALAIVALFAPSLGIAQESADELAKKLSNPVASLISVPMQYNVDFDIGTANGTKHYLNVQPVIPHSLNEHMNLITRVIVPVIYQDDVFGDSGDQFGLGDITPSFFFSPKEPVGGWILGAGPVFLLPTATDELLGGEKWGAGPTVLALQQTPGGGPTARSSTTSGRLPATTIAAISAARSCSPSWPSSFPAAARSLSIRIQLRLERGELERAAEPRLFQGHASGARRC